MAQIRFLRLGIHHFSSGVTFNIDPKNAGQLECNGREISENDYVRYRIRSKIECEAFPNAEFEFKSWSGDLKLNSESQSQTTFNSTSYGNITAFFDTPVVLNLPEGYWDQVRLAVASVIIPAVIGWLIPSIASFINGKRQRRSMRKTMQDIILLQNDEPSYDDETFAEKLSQIRGEIIRKLTTGKISESQYDILNSN